MATKFSWTCPYCNRDATITDSNFSQSTHYFDKDNKQGYLGLATQVTTCTNENCKEYEIYASLNDAVRGSSGSFITKNEILTWQMKPNSLAKQFPTYIPAPIIADYEEACLIRDLSPKASATLSRRCLQGIIRDFWRINKSRLVDEINALEEKIDPTTWKAIDAVRSIGNIGAHMEGDINLIVDVEPQEAQLLIGLIEILIKDWYISKHERQKHLESIIGVAKQKSEDKKAKPT